MIMPVGTPIRDIQDIRLLTSASNMRMLTGTIIGIATTDVGSVLSITSSPARVLIRDVVI